MADAKTFTPGRSRPRLLTRLRRRLFRSIPLLVWCGAIAVIFCLAEVRRSPAPYPGITQVTRYTVTAPTQAKLMALLVKEQELVAADQLVGRLDSADLQLRLQRSRAEVTRLQAETAKEAALLRIAEEERVLVCLPGRLLVPAPVVEPKHVVSTGLGHGNRVLLAARVELAVSVLPLP